MGFGQTANWPSLTPYVDIFSGPFLEVIARKTSILQHRGLKKCQLYSLNSKRLFFVITNCL
jgi:hypothetical protein